MVISTLTQIHVITHKPLFVSLFLTAGQLMRHQFLLRWMNGEEGGGEGGEGLSVTHCSVAFSVWP